MPETNGATDGDAAAQSQDRPQINISRDVEEVGSTQVQILHCAGFVDAATLDSFQAAVLQPLEQQSCNLVLDLSGITYISSSGLGIILAAYREARELSGQLVVAALSPKLANIFQLLGFHRLIPTRPTIGEALECFR